MSVKQMGMVWDLELRSNKKFVLLAYADHANDDGSGVFPTYRRVAHKTGYSREQVRRITRELVAEGLMEKVAEATPYGRGAEYQLCPERGVNLPPLDAERGDTKIPTGGGQYDPSPRGTPMTPEPSGEPSYNRQSPPGGGYESELSTSPETNGKVGKLSPQQAQRQWDELTAHDFCGEKLTELSALLAEENKTGQVSITKVWREIGKPYQDYREKHPEITEAAWEYGFEQALTRGAPNIRYVRKAAQNYHPVAANGGNGRTNGHAKPPNVVTGVTQDDYAEERYGL